MSKICRSVIQYRSFRYLHVYSDTKKIDPRFKNPCTELQQYIEVPLFKEGELPFTPSIQDMKKSQKIFTPDTDHQIKYLTSAVDPDGFPQHDLPEVTFIGRSNVGKSSLLRAIFAKVPGLVRTSKKPGSTQMVNFFQVGQRLCLVDMPGYGFRQPKCFLTGVEGYLKTRPKHQQNGLFLVPLKGDKETSLRRQSLGWQVADYELLKRTFLLVDGKVGFQRWDEVALEMLEEFSIPYGLVITKIDKAIPSQRLRNLLYLQQVRDKYSSVSCFPQPFMTSSITGEGIAYLQAFIAHITGNLALEAS